MGKRKRLNFRSVADIDFEKLPETSDPQLALLSQCIIGEVQILESLEKAIDEGVSDAEPVITASKGAAAEADRRPGEEALGRRTQPSLDNNEIEWQRASILVSEHEDGTAEEHEWEGAEHGKQVGYYVNDFPESDSALLRAQMRRARDRRRKKRKKDFASFDLASINSEIEAFIGEATDEGGLELPDFSKMQRLQIRALAAVYGLEARACGRTGQTLFKTERSGPLTEESLAQVERLLACSMPSGKPTPALKQELDRAMRANRAALTRPISADNRGSVMLRQMGWSEGSGLGAQRQGRTEPVPMHVNQRRQGLGS